MRQILILSKKPHLSETLKAFLQRLCPSKIQCFDSSIKELGVNLKKYGLIFLDHSFRQFYRDFSYKDFIIENKMIPLIEVVEKNSVRQAVMAMREGVLDVIEFPLDINDLGSCLKRLKNFKKYKGKTESPPVKKNNENSFWGMIGRSSKMKKIFSLVNRIHESSINVLITGPSGSGKELLAKAIHSSSKRADKKFFALNCSAIPETLLEAELFGYQKGAFTDAHSDKKGLFEISDGGTLFLDEIAYMPLSVQPKILRVLQEKEIRPLGSLEAIKVDVRIIAASNQKLEEKVSLKEFREDLYYRLNSFQFDLPSLYERREDIPFLVDSFIEKFSKVHSQPPKRISEKALHRLMNYTWPGNIRELENVMERALLFAKDKLILSRDLHLSQTCDIDDKETSVSNKKKSLYEVEKTHILEVLDSTGGNRSKAAEILGIGRKTLYNKLSKYI